MENDLSAGCEKGPATPQGRQEKTAEQGRLEGAVFVGRFGS
jgi:hypothetical protein